jgi:hypothetical protein
MKRAQWCHGSGFTFPRGASHPQVREEEREVVYRGSTGELKVMRMVSVVTCWHCGRVVRIRPHMFNISYHMVVRHKQK